MIKRALTLVNAVHITASEFIDDAERGPQQDHENWLVELAPHAPPRQCWPKRRLHNRTGEDNTGGHLKRHGPPSEAAVVAVTSGRLDCDTWE
jgi:thiamine phosphate synthase YjbQ (UPF0047 family)